MKETNSISSEKSNDRIENIVFYTDMMRLIRIHLRFFSHRNSSESLAAFIKSHSRSCDSVENMPIQADRMSEISSRSSSLKYSVVFEDQKILFLNELRILVLSVIKSVSKNSQKTLQRYHFFLHLIELSLDSTKDAYQKMNEFLNVNFVLDPKDIVSHASRGNYGEVININPSLGPAIEELHAMASPKQKQILLDWKEKHNIPDSIFRILTGEHKEFDNDLERYCYYKLHNIGCDFTCDTIDMINGNTGSMKTLKPGFLKLMFILVYPCAEIKEYERCFEKLFSECFEMDYLVGLDFLSFSRKCNFYFKYIIDRIPLNCITVESLIRFSQKNGLNKTLIAEKFAYMLQNKKEYDQLCRFILSNTIINFKYSKDFMRYFIDHFDKFRFFASDEIMKDGAIRFMSNMSNIESIEESGIMEIIQSEYFLYFVDDVFHSIKLRENLSEKFILGVIGVLYDIENSTGVVMKSYKSILAHKLIR